MTYAEWKKVDANLKNIQKYLVVLSMKVPQVAQSSVEVAKLRHTLRHIDIIV